MKMFLALVVLFTTPLLSSAPVFAADTLITNGPTGSAIIQGYSLVVSSDGTVTLLIQNSGAPIRLKTSSVAEAMQLKLIIKSAGSAQVSTGVDYDGITLSGI